MTRPRMEGSGDVWQVQPGTDVVDLNGAQVGKVYDLRDGYITVRRGRFFVSDSYIPFAAIASHDDRTIYLDVVADEQALEIWHQRPVVSLDASNQRSAQNMALDMETQLDLLTDKDGNVHIPVTQEELKATVRPVTRGVVRIETQVFGSEHTLAAPGSMERVRVERRVHGHDAAGQPIVLKDGTFEVPFHGQEVDSEKEVRVIEEIIITREAVESVRRVRGTVQRSDVEVHETTPDIASQQ